MHVTLTDTAITARGTTARVRCVQSFSRGGFSDRGPKEGARDPARKARAATRFETLCRTRQLRAVNEATLPTRRRLVL
jgi:hypothetical protein